MESISLFTERIIISGPLTLCGRYYISWIDRIYNTYIGLFKAIIGAHSSNGFGLLKLLDTQTDCVQDTAQRMKLTRLKASTTLMIGQTDAEQERPTIKKLEVKQVDFKLGEDCWEMQVKRQLKNHEKNYTTYNLKLGTVVFALKIWRHYLYGTKSVIYTDHKSLQHIFSQKELNMRQRRYKVKPGKENVVADALSRKERVKPKRVRALNRSLSVYQVRILAVEEVVVLVAGMKKVIDEYVNSVMEMEGIAMDFVTKFPRTSSGHDTVWVIMDRLTKSAHFLPMREEYKMERALGTRLDMSTAYHPQTDGQSERTIQTLEDMLRACILDFGGSWDVHLPLVEFSYNNSYHSSVRCALFEALYGRKCRSPIMWAEVGEGQLIGPERKPLEFSVGDYVLLKVSPWKGVVCFGKKGKLAPRFVGPFEIIEKVGPVAYRLDLPEELNGVHDTFHVSNLKKCLADPTLQVPLDEIRVDAKLNFVEEPVEILEREFKKLKRSRIAIVKVRWNSKRGPEFTWEREDQMKLKYPHLFSDVSS
ncbi:putative reverse transcriptase domain-containing protein [Tanacetum coccineum]|uniref:Reverse transcriptase domain-containing protein n=1 Tax=Tanacetum coccineum TaxID=301880 RepID=A0ABQ5EVY2_9ASTR